jgi:hypothetical protein
LRDCEIPKSKEEVETSIGKPLNKCSVHTWLLWYLLDNRNSLQHSRAMESRREYQVGISSGPGHVSAENAGGGDSASQGPARSLRARSALIGQPNHVTCTRYHQRSNSPTNGSVKYRTHSHGTRALAEGCSTTPKAPGKIQYTPYYITPP